MVSGLMLGVLIVGGILLLNINGIRDKLNIQALSFTGNSILSPLLNLSAFEIRRAALNVDVFGKAINPITQSGSFVQQVDEEGRPVATFGTGIG